jgi:hypothetical protein
LAKNIGKSANIDENGPEISDFWPFSRWGLGVFGRAGCGSTKERKYEEQEKNEWKMVRNDGKQRKTTGKQRILARFH